MLWNFVFGRPQCVHLCKACLFVVLLFFCKLFPIGAISSSARLLMIISYITGAEASLLLVCKIPRSDKQNYKLVSTLELAELKPDH